MNVDAYLQRIDCRAGDTLARLHTQHLLTVPFENLDIHLGRPIVLGEAALFEKIVTRRRGGFCYECNGLFAWLLRQLGHRVTLLSAGVAREAGDFGPEFDHLALLVDGEWLADVGFGEGFREPLQIGETEAQGNYRIVFYRGVPQYRFTMTPRRLQEFAARCLYHQTSPESSFTRSRLCTLATPEGRITLTGNRFIVTNGAGRMERELGGEAEFAAILRDRFGVVIEP